jgi:hypothetical protein
LDHPELLADALNIDLELTNREHPVGSYSVDLIGRDITNDCTLIVENQLTTTDHGHLGQLLTYAAGTDAATVVWIATEFRDEHRQAIDYLNHIGGEEVRFFAAEIRLLSIDSGRPAPILQLVAYPNDWHTTATSEVMLARLATDRQQKYHAYWERLLIVAREEGLGWASRRKAPRANWLNIPGRVRGGHYALSFAADRRIRVELYIDGGSATENAFMYAELVNHRTDIESSFGGPLSWEELEGRRACRVAYYTDGQLDASDEHEVYISWMLDSVRRLETALLPYL